ncbi:MAG: hypothetical protein HYZ14_09460 [Bacteroidetes bacterium]|nr:hypothetical protein [Bacteroidota bacterium]
MIIRVIAAIFSQGYGMHDDHFLIIEAASSWADGYDYNHWLPWSPDSTGKPEGHSFTYVGLNFVYFYCMKFLGIADPKILMLINRLLHALFSMLIVYFGIKITEKISAPSGEKTARKNAVIVGWILALLWILPFLSVRNLVEMTCIPFILWSVWLMLKNENKRNFLLAGILMGMAISFRYQVGVFAFGFAAVYFFQFRWSRFLLFSAGVTLTFALTQGLVDYLIWGYPFAEFTGYFTYNSNEGTAYIPNENYFMYLLVLMGSCLFPLGLLLGTGFFVSARKYFLLFVPVILFVLFHSVYPSKQERFILPVLPLFIILGVVGYNLISNTAFRQKIWNFSYRFFWILNIPLLLVVSVAYSKQSRVEAMYYFYENNEKPQKILLEATGETGLSMTPRFYSGQWHYGMLERTDTSQLLTVYPNYSYDFILFYGERDLDKRIAQYKKLYPEMELGKRCEPSFTDRFLRRLNPRNSNEYIEVWKTNAPAR